MSEKGQGHREKAEFSRYTREVVFKRSGGRCEWPDPPCYNPHDRSLDHITPCYLGRLLGMEPKTLKSIDNAQVLCTEHNEYKTKFLERYFILQREYQLLGGKVTT